MQAGKGSATLSMAYAAARFGESCLLALSGRPNLVECAYVESHLTPLPFFASRVVLGPNGVQVRAACHAARAALTSIGALDHMHHEPKTLKACRCACMACTSCL